MNILKKILCLLIVATHVNAAINATTVWFVDPLSGNDNYGGAFDVSAGGTNCGINTTPCVTFDGATIAASGLASTTLTISGYTPQASDVGNHVRITGGTGSWILGTYRITAKGATTWTLDRNPATGASSAMTGYMGGALATTAPLFDAGATTARGVPITGNKVFVKSDATMVITSSQSITNPGTVGGDYMRLIGYTTTPGDGGRATIQMSGAFSGTAVALYSPSTKNSIENIVVDCNSVTASTGIVVTSNSGSSRLINNVIKNCPSGGVAIGAINTYFTGNEITACGSTASGALYLSGNNGNGFNVGNYIHDNATDGIFGSVSSPPTTIVFNVVANNTGYGLNSKSTFILAMFNTFYNNSSGGITNGSAVNTFPTNIYWGNILENNGGYGIQCASANGLPTGPHLDGNWYYNNASGDRQYCDNNTGVDAYATYTSVREVDGTADAFVNAAGGDFRLNNVPGGGTSAKYAGVTGLSYILTNYGRPDMGAIQALPMFGGGN